MLALWSRLVVCFAIGAAALSGAALSADTAADADASCRLPFETLKDPNTGNVFPLSAALNDNSALPDNLRQRYIVADLNSADEDGYCRGVREHFSALGDLSDFPRLRAIAAERNVDIATLANATLDTLAGGDAGPEHREILEREVDDLKNYLQQVERHKGMPLVRPPTYSGFCVGQTLSLCEIVNGQPKLVFRFATSSSKWSPQLNRYYAPINFINSRSWGSDRRYTAADARRDARFGGGSGRLVPFANDGEPIVMPNFLHFLPMPGYAGETRNGIHQTAGGLDSGGTLGAPASLGCIRLGKFQSKVARWWTPTQAKFFVHFEPNRYRKFGIASTGKARGFRSTDPSKVETAAITKRTGAGETAHPRPRSSASRKPEASSPYFPFSSIFWN